MHAGCVPCSPSLVAARVRRLRARAAAQRPTRSRSRRCRTSRCRRRGRRRAARRAPSATAGSRVRGPAARRAGARGARLQRRSARSPRRASSRRPRYAKLAGATLYPQVNLLARGGGKCGGDGSGLTGVGLFASWELDLWGRVRSERGSRQDAVRVRASRTPSTRASRSPRWSPRAGSSPSRRGCSGASPQDMVRASEQRAGARARSRCASAAATSTTSRSRRPTSRRYRDTVLQLDARVRSRRSARSRRWSAATRRRRSRWRRRCRGCPAPVPVGLPSELLERRPDVVAAERRVAAAFYRVGRGEGGAPAAHLADRERRRSISSELFVLKNRDNPVWSAGAATSLAPIFNGGALQAQVEIRTAEQKAAVADYGRIGARAFGEVEDALSARIRRRRARGDPGAVGRRERARAGARAGALPRRLGRPARGAAAEPRALRGARRARCACRASGCVQRVNLHLALGGGFEVLPPAPEAGPVGAARPEVAVAGSMPRQ